MRRQFKNPDWGLLDHGEATRGISARIEAWEAVVDSCRRVREGGGYADQNASRSAEKIANARLRYLRTLYAEADAYFTQQPTA